MLQDYGLRGRSLKGHKSSNVSLFYTEYTPSTTPLAYCSRWKLRWLSGSVWIKDRERATRGLLHSPSIKSVGTQELKAQLLQVKANLFKSTADEAWPIIIIIIIIWCKRVAISGLFIKGRFHSSIILSHSSHSPPTAFNTCWYST